MNKIYARETLPKSIFLCGPTPRDAETQSWRPEALSLIELNGFDGTVFIPEDRDEKRAFDYDDQVQWEWEGMSTATIILFWVPRELKKMPALVTNVEFGLYIASGKVVFGAPPEAQKIGYLKALANRYNTPVFSTLSATVAAAVNKARDPYATGLFRLS